MAVGADRSANRSLVRYDVLLLSVCVSSLKPSNAKHVLPPADPYTEKAAPVKENPSVPSSKLTDMLSDVISVVSSVARSDPRYAPLGSVTVPNDVTSVLFADVIV